MKLTKANKNEIIKAYAQRMVADLDIETLAALAIDNYESNMWGMNLESIKALVEIYAPDLLENN